MGFRPGGPMRMFGEVEKSKNIRQTLLRLWGYLKHQKWPLIWTSILVITTSFISLLGPFLMGLAIDRYILESDLTGLALMLGLMLLTYIIASAGTWLQTYIMVGVSQNVVREMRDELFRKLQALPVKYFDQHPHGDIMSRMTNDLENVSNILTTSFSQLISSVLSLIGVVIMMLVLNLPLAIVSLVIMPMTYFLTKVISKRTRAGFRETQKTLGELNGIIEENVTGLRTVKAFCGEEKSIASFNISNRHLQKAAFRARVFAGAMGPLMNLINNLGLAIVATTGGWLAIQGFASVGTIAAFINYSNRLGWPLNMIAQLYNSIQSALAGAERVFDLMDQVPETDLLDAIHIKHLTGDVSFDRVFFSYVPEVPVLKDITFTVKPGQLIAFVGPTGAGKTTIANLLNRFYEIENGAIYVNGIDVKQIIKKDLRKCIGLVLQDNFLFADTVMENIRYGNLNSTDEEVIGAARLANADTFIHHLPQGYQTVLSERGSNLSQGQRQLLAIARAIIANPEILILDEATSNVDTRTEKHLQEALLRLMKGRTSFVIAHRLSTIRDADQVLVINDGKLIESGTHLSLLQANGIYHRLYVSQFKGQMLAEEAF
jgi:ATP-binding cassette subfamily B protein